MSLEEKQDLEAFLNMLKINFQWSMVDSITGEPLYSRKPFLKLGMMDDDGGSLSSSPTENLSSPLRHSNKLDSPASSNSTNVSYSLGDTRTSSCKFDYGDDISDGGDRSRSRSPSISPPKNLSSPLLNSADSPNCANVHDSPSYTTLQKLFYESVYKPVTISSARNIKINIDVSNPRQADTNNNQNDGKEVMTPPYQIGFKNYGNTCYINASIQGTIGLCYFVQRIISTFDGPLKSGKSCPVIE